jgi:hypothetical protein
MNQIINLKRVADLGSEFITLQEAKTQLRVDFTDDDTEITALITKARRLVENYCSISIVYQRIELVAILEHCWKLPYGPVIGIESVADSTGTQGSAPVNYTTSTNDWRFDGDSFDPGVYSYRNKIVYTAGNHCPEDLKQVILKVITHLYENRGRTSNEDNLDKILKEADHYKVLLWT